MSHYRNILSPYKGPATRHACPACGRRYKFSRYIDTTTGNELADHVGRCDRENSCGYHFTPKQFFTENPAGIEQEGLPISAKVPIENNPIEYLPFGLLEKSVTRHEQCDIFPFLEKLFRKSIARKICEAYFIGSNKDQNTAFWQVDVGGKVRQCKIMRYGQDGHRDKASGAIFAGKKILNNQEANLQQCFFGEYLLSFPENENIPVAIVESEKTAVICSVYYENFIWLATGGKTGCKWTEANVCKVLKGKKVVLFPDLGAYDSWKGKGLLMAATAGCKVAISDYLEKEANEQDKINGLDLADYLLRVQDGSELALTGLAAIPDQYPIIFDYLAKTTA